MTLNSPRNRQMLNFTKQEGKAKTNVVNHDEPWLETWDYQAKIAIFS